MKRKPLILFVASSLISALLMCGCSEKPKEPETLEEMISSSSEVADILENDKSEGVSVEVKGNEVTYTCDISSLEGLPSDILDNEDLKKNFEASIDSQASSFQKTCASLEEKTGLSGISVNVVYTYDGQEYVRRTFTSAPADTSSSEDKSEQSS